MLWEGFLVKIPKGRLATFLRCGDGWSIRHWMAMTCGQPKLQDDVQIMEGDDIEPCLLYQPLGALIKRSFFFCKKGWTFFNEASWDCSCWCQWVFGEMGGFGLAEARWWKRDGSRASLQQWATGTFDDFLPSLNSLKVQGTAGMLKLLATIWPS